MIFLSFFVLFSCGNKTSIDIEEKGYKENKKIEFRGKRKVECYR